MTPSFPPIRERLVPADFLIYQAATGGKEYARSIRLFTMGECRIMVSRDPFGPGDLRWHISISCERRNPTWEELKHVQNTLKPGVFFCVPMPPREYWINIHEHTYHLEEVKDAASIRQWSGEGRTIPARHKAST